MSTPIEENSQDMSENESETSSINNSLDSSRMDQRSRNMDEDSDEETDSDEEVESSPKKKKGGRVPKNLYNPDHYKNLDVSSEIKQLFNYITDYKASVVDLDTPLKPFIPDYLPAVGELDNFIKPARPDGKEEHLGLKVLDEPNLELSNPKIIRKMMELTRKKMPKGHTDEIQFLEKGDSTDEVFEKKLGAWIVDTEQQLHKKKSNTTVTFDDDMPDLTTLMQTWPDEYDQLVGQIALPSAQINLSLYDYARVVLALTDIPLYGGKIIKSLHVFFSLYSECKKNMLFQQQQEEDDEEGEEY